MLTWLFPLHPQLNESDKASTVIRSAMEKHGLRGSPSHYTLVLVTEHNSEFMLRLSMAVQQVLRLSMAVQQVTGRSGITGSCWGYVVLANEYMYMC